MSNSRTGGPVPPEGTRGHFSEAKTEGQPRRVVGEVKKVGEVDPDQKKRAAKFQQMLENAEEKLKKASENPPSLFALVKENQKASAKTEVPQKGALSSQEEDPLPHAKSFWNHQELPDEPLPPQVPLQETRRSMQKDEERLKKEAPRAASRALTREEEVRGPQLSEKEREKAPLAQTERAPIELPPKRGEKERKAVEKEREKAPLAQTERAPVEPPPKSGEREEEEPAQLPVTPSLPVHIESLATAATNRAALYLNAEVEALFHQIVGTIFVMTESKPGITRTEIVLNAPSFAHSRFFGATITIEKFATAPDSLNIRLSGSNQAVDAFNQNLPNLMAAFEQGNFNFRVHRLDAIYTEERPLFRRKEGSGSEGFGGDLQEGRR